MTHLRIEGTVNCYILHSVLAALLFVFFCGRNESGVNFRTDLMYIYKGIKNNPSSLKNKTKTTNNQRLHNMLERFYIPNSGTILDDDILHWGVGWGGIQGLTGVSRRVTHLEYMKTCPFVLK